MNLYETSLVIIIFGWGILAVCLSKTIINFINNHNNKKK